MHCPRKRGELAHLPGQTRSDSARILYAQLKAGEVDPAEFLKVFDMSGKWAHPVSLETLSYASAAVVIDQYWSHIRQFSYEEVLARAEPNDERPESYEAQVDEFQYFLLHFLRSTQLEYVNNIRSRLAEKPRTREDEISFCFFLSAIRLNPSLTALPMVSMADLVVWLGRLAKVAPALFKRDVATHPSFQDVVAALRHPGTLRLTSGLMTNTREMLYPFFAWFEGTKVANLDDVGRCFQSGAFRLISTETGRYFAVTPDVVGTIRSRIEELAPSTGSLPLAFGCPALYSGKLKEMHEWVLTLFEKWVTATP